MFCNEWERKKQYKNEGRGEDVGEEAEGPANQEGATPRREAPAAPHSQFLM